MSDFNLDSLREEIERVFAPMTLTVGTTEVVLGNPIRLPQKKRQELKSAFEKLDRVTRDLQLAAEQADDEDAPEVDTDELENELLDAAQQVVRVAAGEHGDLLVNSLGDDLQLTMKLIEVWGKKVTPGEASSSEN